MNVALSDHFASFGRSVLDPICAKMYMPNTADSDTKEVVVKIDGGSDVWLMLTAE